MSVNGSGQIVREAIRFDRGALQIARGIRFAVGVGVPLFLGVVTGRLVEGVAISVGAALVGLTDSGAPYRSRVPAMLFAAIGVAVSTFVDEVTGRRDRAADVVELRRRNVHSHQRAGLFRGTHVAAGNDARRQLPG